MTGPRQHPRERMSGLSRLRNRKGREKGETMERCRTRGQNDNKKRCLKAQKTFCQTYTDRKIEGVLQKHQYGKKLRANIDSSKSGVCESVSYMSFQEGE